MHSDSTLDTRETNKVAEKDERRGEDGRSEGKVEGRSEEVWLPRDLDPTLRRAMAARMETLFAKHEPRRYPKWRARVESEQDMPSPDDPSRWPERWLPLLALSMAALVFLRAKQKIDWDDWNSPSALRLERTRVLLLKIVYRGVVARGEYVPQRLRSQKKPVSQQGGTS